jgi:NADPH:quinone reductase-like Zn-dependent oxidoreductase
MAENRGALVASFDEPPQYRVVPEPQPDGEHEIVDVLAVGIHPATRGIAAGRHYTSLGSLPVLAGADAVVRRPDGSLAYVMGPGAGTLAERIAIDPAAAVPVPAGADTAVVAATMNPALSSWAALRGRAGFQPGQSVLVMGATGNAGSMAVRAARQLGASRVVAADRNQTRLRELLSEGADEIVAITADENATAASFAAAAARTRRRGRRGRTHRHSAHGSACRGRAGMVPLGPPRRAHGDYSLTRRSLSCERGPHCHGSFMYGT